MTETEIQRRRRAFLEHTQAALKKVKWARHYALGDRELLAIAALLSEWQAERAQHDEGFTREAAAEFLDSLRDHVPTLFQNRPPDEPQIPQLLKDPVTGNIPANPWSEGSINVTEQQIIARDYPDLAAYLKATANGLTYSTLLKQKAEKARREQLREITYDEDSHRTNPYVNNADLTRLSEFRRSRGDAVADFYKREATEPVQLPWVPDPATGRPPNLTASMAFKRAAPELAELCVRSIETARQWSQEIVSSVEKQISELEARRASARSLLEKKIDAVKAT
jgi:hypothetical protein